MAGGKIGTLVKWGNSADLVQGDFFDSSVCKTQLRVTDIGNKLMVTKAERQGRDKLGDWDCHIHTTIYKIDN